MIKCPKCKSTKVHTESYKKYRCQCGLRFTSLSMSQRVSYSDGYDYYPATQIYTELSNGWDTSESDAYGGGSGGGGGSSRSWEDSGSSYDSGSDSGDCGGDD